MQDNGSIFWWYWDALSWMLFDKSGVLEAGPVEHRYGRVPIVRVFDRRQPRFRNIGLPRYEAIAELQRE